MQIVDHCPMSGESRGSRDNPGNSTSQEAPLEAAESATTSNRSETMNWHRSRTGRGFRSKPLSTRLPDIMRVTCGHLEGELHVKKVGSGSRSPCIYYNNMWVTPNQFENQAGKTYLKNWQWAIRHDRIPLHTYVKWGLIKPHSQRCDCVLCRTCVPHLKKVLGKNLKRKPAYCPSSDGTVGNGERGDQPSFGAPRRGSGGRRGRGRLATFSSKRSKRSMQKSIYRPVKRACSAKMSSRPSDRARRVRRGGWGRLTRTLIEAQSEGTDVNLCVETQPSASTDACDNELNTWNGKQQEREIPSNGSSLASSSALQVQRPQDLLHPMATTSARKEQTPESRTDVTGERPSSSSAAVNSRGETAAPPKLITAHRDDKSAFTSADSTTHLVKNIPKNFRSRRFIALKTHVNAIRGDTGLANRAVESWTVDDVAAFLDAAGFRWQSSSFREQLINGEALLHLREDHLEDIMKLKLGTALRLISIIRCLQ